MHKAIKGVTLIEMLAVVGIIALLAVLVLPGLKHLENQSKERVVRNLLAMLDSVLTEYYAQTGSFPDSNTLDTVTLVEVAEQDRVAYQIQYLVQLLRDEPACSPLMERINSKLMVNRAFKNHATLDIGPELYDPWEGLIHYVYYSHMNFPRISSAGPDRTFGTADDIINRI